MRAWSFKVVLVLLLGPAFAVGALGSPGIEGQEPPGVESKEPAKKPGKDKRAKPSVPHKPEKKKGADPNNDGGAQKSLSVKTKICARGRLAKHDREVGKIEVTTPEEMTVGLRLTDKTTVRVDTKAGSLADLKEGAWATVYCPSEGPLDVAISIRIERRPPPP